MRSWGDFFKVATLPTPVKFFNGQAFLSFQTVSKLPALQEGSLCARSCSCGPESSACVTVRGEVGAKAFRLPGAGLCLGGNQPPTLFLLPHLHSEAIIFLVPTSNTALVRTVQQRTQLQQVTDCVPASQTRSR